MIKVSIIIPVYNVQAYIERCLKSVTNQTYMNLEIILIDDGSTDESGKICDEYAKKDKRIKCFHKQNGGLSSARNYAIKYITGNYVMYIDSDDWIKNNTIEVLVNLLEGNDFDIIEFGYQYVDENEKNIGKIEFHSSIINKTDEILKEFFYGRSITEVVWNKIYKAKLIKKIKFVEGRKYEDYMYTPEVLSQCNNIKIINDIFYYYLQRAGSIVNSNFNNDIFDKIYAGEYVEEFCKNNQEKYYYIARIRLMFCYIAVYQKIYNSDIRKEDKKIYKQKIKEKYNEIFKSVRNTNAFKKLLLKRKILLFLCYYNINLYCILCR